MTLRGALRYQPQRLAFGTSGLRGLVADLSQLEAAINTSGFLRYLLETKQVNRGDAVFLAGDLRPSTAHRVDAAGMARGNILQAVQHAVLESGFRPVHLGWIPTPALLHYALGRECASIMVTGSHIPFDRNGIKFNKPRGEVLKADEPEILARVEQVRNEAYESSATDSAFGTDGMLKSDRCMELGAPEDPGRAAFLERYLRAFPNDCLRGRRVLVYEHSAVGRDLLTELLRGLGADVRVGGRSEEFVPIDTEAVDERMLEVIQQLADMHGGSELDAVVSTDGDSDRPLLLAVDSGRVRHVSGDLLGLLVADFLGCRHVAVPINANEAVDLQFKSRGVQVVKTKIGSPYVVAAMREAGWEANGGFLTACPCSVPGGGTLSPLPTRDAFLPLLAALNASLGRGLTISACLDLLPQRFGRSGLLRDFPLQASSRILARFQPADARIEHVEFDEGGVRVRRLGESAGVPPGAELLSDLQRCRLGWEEAYGRALGCAQISWMDFLDGTRVGLADESVVHVRPSGNAPEFRAYTTAPTLAKAERLLQETLRISRELAEGGSASESAFLTTATTSLRKP